MIITAATCPALSALPSSVCPALSALPCPTLPCPVCPAPSALHLPFPALPCLPCPTLPCPALTYPSLPCPTLPCPALSALPCLPCLALPCPALPALPALPCPVSPALSALPCLVCPALPCPVLYSPCLPTMTILRGRLVPSSGPQMPHSLKMAACRSLASLSAAAPPDSDPFSCVVESSTMKSPDWGSVSSISPAVEKRNGGRVRG